jgi:hypothetical protein
MAGRIAHIKRFTGTGGQNGIGTVSTTTGTKWRLLFATAKYSASPTQAGVTLTLDSGADTAFDVVLNTGSANAQTTVYIPTPDTIIIQPDDVLTLTAPAGGGVITNAVAIYVEEVF